MRTAHDIILAPVVSEKSYDLIENFNTYTFEVDPRSNKEQIKHAPIYDPDSDDHRSEAYRGRVEAYFAAYS